MSLIIEDDVPLPGSMKREDSITGTLRALQPGQSVFIPGKRAVDMSGFVSSAGMSGKLTMRSIDGGVRVWRKEE